MKNQITERTSINVRCDKCNRKNDLISDCCVVTSLTLINIYCHACVQVLQKQLKLQKLHIEQVNDILLECQKVQAFITQYNLVELVSNSIFVKTLEIVDPLKELLQNSKEFQYTINLNEADFKIYCQKRILYKQILEDEVLKKKIENASQNFKNIIKQYFYDEEGIPFFSIQIPKSKYIILYSQVLSNYFLILKYYTQSEYLSQLNNKELEKKIMKEGYNPCIFIQIYDLNNKNNIYEDVLIQNQKLEYLSEELIKSYLLEQRNIIYICVDNDYYQININSKQHPQQINDVNFQVIGENLIFLGQDTLLKFDPIDYEIIQQKSIFERNWSNNEFLISYDKRINSFLMYNCPSHNQNEIIEIIQLNTLRFTKRIIFANYERYDYNSFYYQKSFNYIFNISTIVLIRESHEGTAFLILLNLQTNKIIRKIPLSFKQPLQNLYILKNQTMVCLKYQFDQVDMYSISTGKQIVQFEQLQLYPIMQNEQLAICIKQDDIKLFKLVQ
ncbi:unnamed protein product [Paramecium primaurelia]|uniref:Uncharacterized protein n=1 Tax=Paramecium primaurelia TaxID=5886 RepID=A0A8S1KQ21_PARPR|nr:unnamed protein product [Paramecium primaurelia]